jgi:hypothetical protein
MRKLIHCYLAERYQMTDIIPPIPLRWVKDNIDGAKFAFRDKGQGSFTYLGAPISADFELSYESLAPYVTKVLDLAAPLEGCGLMIRLVEIKNNIVKVW